MDSDTPVLDATVASVEDARRRGQIGASDAGAVAALLALARKIDMQDEYFQALAELAEENNSRPPSVDNVSLPTYLKYCDSLGLTPSGRERLSDKPAAPGGKLGRLQAIAGGKT